MAARKTHTKLSSDWRQRIRNSGVLARLIDHALGKQKMTVSEVRAADIVLRKALPDLKPQHAAINIANPEVELKPLAIQLVRLAASGAIAPDQLDSMMASIGTAIRVNEVEKETGTLQGWLAEFYKGMIDAEERAKAHERDEQRRYQERQEGSNDDQD